MEPDPSAKPVQADGISCVAHTSFKISVRLAVFLSIVFSVGQISLQMMIRHDGLLMQKAIDEFVVVF